MTLILNRNTLYEKNVCMLELIFSFFPDCHWLVFILLCLTAQVRLHCGLTPSGQTDWLSLHSVIKEYSPSQSLGWQIQQNLCRENFTVQSVELSLVHLAGMKVCYYFSLKCNLSFHNCSYNYFALFKCDQFLNKLAKCEIVKCKRNY